MATVTVTWMDGQQEDYPVDKAFVEAGVLRMTPEVPSDPVRYVPLATVRIFQVDGR